MLNYLWACMILIGVIYGGITGRMEQLSAGVLNSVGDAVTLCVTMLGIMAMWCGIMEIARKSGLIASATKVIHPFIKLLFPRIPEGHPALEYITTNFISNLLGLGWAATPAGLKAMEALAQLEKERGNKEYQEQGEGKKSRSASTEMCTFLIMNISSLQLIPVNMIAYRSQYGSSNPAGIIGPAIVATLLSSVAAIIFCKIMEAKNHRKI